MAFTYKAIATVTVGSGGATNIEFTSIPATYTDLVIRLSARTDYSNAINSDGIDIRPNSSTTNRTALRLYGTGSTVTQSTTIYPVGASNASCTANTFGNTEIYLSNYASAYDKPAFVSGTSETNAATAHGGVASFLWADSSAISSIKLLPQNGTNFAQYSTATLYGIKSS